MDLLIFLTFLKKNVENQNWSIFKNFGHFLNNFSLFLEFWTFFKNVGPILDLWTFFKILDLLLKK